MSDPPNRIDIRDIPGPVGARVSGLDPSRLDDIERVGPVLRDAMALRAVLIVEATAVEPGQMLSTLAAILADAGDVPESEPVVRRLDIGPAELADLRRWQTTDSFDPQPPTCTVAAAVRVPKRGGQFQFADMRRAAALLPQQDLAEMRPLRLVHRRDRLDPGSADATQTAEHDWIRTTTDGRPSLFMGAGASHIVGRDLDESRQWFAEIEAQLPVHDVFLEHHWRPGDIVAWDHRIVLHRMLGFDAADEHAVFDLATR